MSTASGGDGGKGDKSPANGVGGGGVGKEGKGGALVEPVGDAEEAGNDGDGVAKSDADSHERLGDAIGDDDERGEEEEPGEACAGRGVTRRPPG